MLIDYDIATIGTTNSIKEKYGNKETWTVEHASILDKEFIDKEQNKYDIIYSWGVLHHTGNMDLAIENTIKLAKNDSTIWVSICKTAQDT